MIGPWLNLGLGAVLGFAPPESAVVEGPAEAPEAPSGPVEIAQPEPPAPSISDATAEDLEAARQRAEATLTPPETEGPPFYTEADIDRLRARYNIAPDPRVEPRKPKWRCLIPDPVCGFGVELAATTAYAWRVRQGDISEEGVYSSWHSARIAYDVWVNFPAHTQTIGTYKFTRLTLGPKVAMVASDNQDLWGNFGVALRYWFGTNKWSPALEFSSALSFKLVGERAGETVPQRSPVGITADIGVSVGGWGAIIVGGQYDTPLAREELPEKFRISAAGQVFVGFRGNILWGAPAAAAVGTHIGIQRALPDQP